MTKHGNNSARQAGAIVHKKEIIFTRREAEEWRKLWSSMKALFWDVQQSVQVLRLSQVSDLV